MPIGDAFQAEMARRQQQSQLNRAAMLQKAQNDRLMQQDMMRMMLMMNSPALMRENRLKSQFAQREDDSLLQDKAWVAALMARKPEDLSPAMRRLLPAYQSFYGQNPKGSGKTIAQFLSQGKPQALQLKATVVQDENGNPVTNYEVWDPNAGVPKASPGIPAGGGLSDDASKLINEYELH